MSPNGIPFWPFMHLRIKGSCNPIKNCVRIFKVPDVLLTTVCRPFGGKGEGDSVGAELFHAQVTRSQSIFSYRQVIRCWDLDYIAENIEAPVVVLHYPSKR